MLESIINKTNNLYKKNNIAVIHKKDVDVNFSKVIKQNGKLKVENAYIKKKSFADYYGVFKSKFIAFEAKSTELNSLPLDNIKIHQHNYLKLIRDNGGICFYIFYYKKFNSFFYIDWEVIEEYKGKSLNIEEAKKLGSELELIYPGIIDYIQFCE
ncbi:MAG: Holliday junction resolvase RecU [Mycoplasma sp.]|nr:Holliday junction resolvase RecU [Mycoplasma sp.]